MHRTITWHSYELDRQRDRRARALTQRIERMRRWSRVKAFLADSAYVLAALAVGAMFAWAWIN